MKSDAANWTADSAAPAAIDAASVHATYGDFVWRTLQRLGIWSSDLPDAYQEVFVVVHRRSHTFDGSARVTTWLFAICMRVTAAYRRRAHRRHELPTDFSELEFEADGPSPEASAENAQARARLVQVLESMVLEQRAVFVLFEIEGMTCDEIAVMTGTPLGTVYSRLRAARQHFERAAARVRASDANGRSR